MKLIYVYDALCGWCYGFSPVISKFVKDHKEITEVEVISGGMVKGARIGPIGEVAGYISQAYKEVENKTGIKFGDAFLNDILKEGKAIFNSIPAAIAMGICKRYKPEIQIDFASAIQKGIYFDGMEPENKEGFATIAAKYGFDKNNFLQKMNDPKYLALAEEEFIITQKWGINGFPTVILDLGEQLVIIAHGAVSYEALETNYNYVIKKDGKDKI